VVHTHSFQFPLPLHVGVLGQPFALQNVHTFFDLVFWIYPPALDVEVDATPIPETSAVGL
jgi:hypothetical protein